MNHKKNSKKIMFLSHTNSLLKGKSGFELDRAEDLRKLVNCTKGFESYLSVVEPFSKNSLFSLIKYPNIVYSYASFKLVLESWNLSKKLSAQKKTFLKKVEFEDSRAEAIFNSLRPLLNFNLSRENIFFVIFYYKLYCEILSKEKIDFLFLYSVAVGDIFSRCAAAAAEEKNIYLGGTFHGYGLALINPLAPDKFLYFVPGKLFKNKLISLGVDKDIIKVTGALFLSKIVKFMNYSKTNNRKYVKKVLFITAPFVESNFIGHAEYFAIITNLFKIFKSFGDLEFIWKSHPREKYIKDYEKVIGALSMNNIIHDSSRSKSDLYSLITGSDLVLSLGSTVDIESFLLNKPVVFLDFIDINSRYFIDDYKESDDVFCVKIKELSKLKDVLNQFVENKLPRKDNVKLLKEFVRENLYSLDDKVSQRIFDAIKNKI
ncbi:hypothetical protein HQ533_02390 [Candidatus Woesearchaeota archaeon]|nr:hypothetical protein [Candidatus Woesearchaeota archaeon]